MMKTLIPVTEEHIKNGKAKDPSCCPVALAVKERMAVKDVFANCYTIRGDIDYSHGFCVRAPDSVYDFITKYDRGEPVEPFSFDLDTDIPEDEEL